MNDRVQKLAPLVAGLALLAAGCGSTAEPAGSATAPSSGSATTTGGTLTVFAAASLKGTFTELGSRFEASHPGTTVTFSFAGSSDLVTQIQSGARADVFASADTKNMDKLTADGLTATDPVTFASNTLEIAVPPDNPAGVASLSDLTKPDVKVVLCAPQVPCGAAAQKVEAAAKIDITPVSEESSVTDVLNKVLTGEADAGLVYVTDVKAANVKPADDPDAPDKVQGVTFPESSSAVNEYPIATLEDAANAQLAQEFVTLVTGTEGQQVLADAGFAKP